MGYLLVAESLQLEQIKNEYFQNNNINVACKTMLY